jgi:hypothetical protein
VKIKYNVASPGQHNVTVGISATTSTALTGLDVDIDFAASLCSHLKDQELRLAGRTSSAAAEEFLEAAACPQEGRTSFILMDFQLEGLQPAPVLSPGNGPIGEWTVSLAENVPVGPIDLALRVNQARNGPLLVNMEAAGAQLIVTRCTGDCDGQGTVTVDEIIKAVNIALGSRPVAECRPGDTSANGEVTVDEIVQGVNNALQGCNS